MNSPAQARARAAFLHACELDVAVRKPGNVSDASPGHGMHAALFRASAQAAATALFLPGTRVGTRIEAAVAATQAAAGCNTNLGILLLCAPLARAVDLQPAVRTVPNLRRAVEAVLAELDIDDARAAYRAIALARPGGLGAAATQDVHSEPSIGLRDAMALAAERDLIARQYRDAYADLFDGGLAALPAGSSADAGKPEGRSAVQHLYLHFLATLPDSHIVRKQGPAVAQTVMKAAQAWLARSGDCLRARTALDDDAEFVRWDASLKASRINPGTTADLTVATLMLAALGDENFAA